MATPYSLVEVDTVPSTQEVARAAFVERAAPVLVTARRQMSGRGRAGAEWLHAPRAIAASLAMPTPWPADLAGPLPLIAGLAARRAIADAGLGPVMLKWPNDLLDGADEKVGGLLVEVADGVIVFGLGVNLWFPDAPDGITGLCSTDPGDRLARIVAEGWAQDLAARIESGPDWDRREYREACATLGKVVVWSHGGPALAVDIAADGALIVDVSGRREELRAGEVRFLRRATLPVDGPTDDVGETRS